MYYILVVCSSSHVVGALGFFSTAIILMAVITVRYLQMETILRATAAMVDNEVSVEDPAQKTSADTETTQEDRQRLCARLKGNYSPF